jgi:hypothetical protein
MARHNSVEDANGVALETRILGFAGFLTANQTGLTAATDEVVDLTADVDPESGWNGTNDEYTVPAAYNGKKMFVTYSVRIDDIPDGNFARAQVEIDTGGGYTALTTSQLYAASAAEIVQAKFGTLYVGTVSTGDKIRLIGHAEAFDVSNQFRGDATVRHTQLQLEFQ